MLDYYSHKPDQAVMGDGWRHQSKIFSGASVSAEPTAR